MITNFNSKMFVFKNISKYFIAFLVYALLSRNPFLFINNMDLIPQINVREVIWFLMRETVNFAYFGLSITFLCVSIVTVFINKCSIFSDLDLACERIQKINDTAENGFLVLDFSNPFLLSSKTKALRE